jgi:hypothetical protein
MIKVTQKEHHEHISIGENEIVLAGPPSSLRGPVVLQNKTNESIFIRDLPLTNPANLTMAFPVHTTLQPMETRSRNIYVSLDPQTPPGTYYMNLQVGNAQKKVKVIVHETLQVQINPQQLVLEGLEPGIRHTKEILFTNKGNITVTIPNIKHNTLTDRDLICRNLSLAIRTSGEEGIEKTMDAFTRGLKKDIADWVDISIEEAGQLVPPGETIVLHLTVILPEAINPNFHYEGEIRMFDKMIRYTAINKATGIRPLQET